MHAPGAKDHAAHGAQLVSQANHLPGALREPLFVLRHGLSIETVVCCLSDGGHEESNVAFNLIIYGCLLALSCNVFKLPASCMAAHPFSREHTLKVPYAIGIFERLSGIFAHLLLPHSGELIRFSKSQGHVPKELSNVLERSQQRRVIIANRRGRSISEQVLQEATCSYSLPEHST